MKHLCVVLPAYNEAHNIGPVVEGVRAVGIDDLRITALVVNDGSRDDTAGIAREAGAYVISHPTNRGVGAAFRTGLEWAVANEFQYLIHMDSDGQVLPSEIPLVFAPVGRDEADLSIGSRFVGEPPAHLARWKALALHGMARTVGMMTGYRLGDLSCGFRCMNRRIMEGLRPHYDYDYIQETLIQALALKARLVEVPITVIYEEEPLRKGMSQRTLRYSQRFLRLTGRALLDFYMTRARALLG